MIDAYEVGIQLALQDGVSAGLEVIGRELAEVDRAIAASNAGLVALTQTAQSAVRAAAAATGTRMPTATQPAGDGALQGETRPVARVDAPQRASASAAASPNTEPARVDSGASPTAERSDVRATSESGARAASAGRRGATTAAAPMPAREEAPDAAPQVAAPVADAVPAAPSVQQNLSVAPPTDTPVAASGPRLESGFPPAAAQPTAAPASAPAGQAAPMRASVAKAIAPQQRRETVVREVGGKGSVLVNMPMTVAMSQAPASAGFAGTNGVAPPTRSTGSLERGAAPQPQARDRGEGGGGSVMLDGRLVGYWLTEQMARDASRPPGGTSFFDPRQSPAWTPSGAL